MDKLTSQSSLLGLAIAIASHCHSTQTDKGGNPYILHPIRVMMRLRTNDCELMQIAILHDCIEDHPDVVNQQTLLQQGFSDRVRTALSILTHDKKEVSYEDYITLIQSNEDCVRVKIEDLRDNSDITRLKGVRNKDLERIRKYHQAYLTLSQKQYLTD